MKKLWPLFLLNAIVFVSPLAGQENDSNQHAERQMATIEGWLTKHLKEKNASKWVCDYILALENKIQDISAKTYFRRFIADPSGRGDSLDKFVQYLSLAGYPDEIILDAQSNLMVQPENVYKAVYFAITYTIMDGLPDGPQVPPSPLTTPSHT